MNLTIYCKSVEVKNCFDGYVQVELLEVDESRYDMVDPDDIEEPEPTIQNAAEAVEKFGIDEILDCIEIEKINEYVEEQEEG